MRPLQILVTVAAALTIAHAAFAGPIIFFHESRQLSAEGLRSQTGEPGAWSASVTAPGHAAASQNTNISAGFVGGFGLAETFSTRGHSRSALYTHFTIDQPYTATLNVELFETVATFTRVFLQSRNSPFELIWNEFGPHLNGLGPAEWAMLITRQDILVPGTYHFFLEADTVGVTESGYGAAGFNGGFSLVPITGTEVPEPASLTLLGLGLLGIARRRMTR